MAEGSAPNLGGRPPYELDKDHFYKLCQIQCTQDEVAAFFGIDPGTVHDWCYRTFEMGYPDCLKKFGSLGKVSLRRKMFQLAQDGNTTMLIWLSKQHLGMKDHDKTILVPAAPGQPSIQSGAVETDDLQARIEKRLLEAK